MYTADATTAGAERAFLWDGGSVGHDDVDSPGDHVLGMTVHNRLRAFPITAIKCFDETCVIIAIGVIS
ncbi:MAG: hypothetical protein ABWX92_02840, partial [Mycetocola sp.]